MRRNGGFTLIELMIAVAIIGVLAGVLVYGLNKPANKVKTGSEAQAMFAELHRAQSQYQLEHGVYHSTGMSSADIYPSSPTKTAQPVALPEEWATLRIQPTAQKLYCGYVAVAGTADDPIPDFAEMFGMEQPTRLWYALYAKCDADGDGTDFAEYFASSVDASLQKRGDGN